MIVFDIEDSFGIEIPYNANEEAADFKTVGSVVERVKALIESTGSGGATASAKASWAETSTSPKQLVIRAVQAQVRTLVQ